MVGVVEILMGQVHETGADIGAGFADSGAGFRKIGEDLRSLEQAVDS